MLVLCTGMIRSGSTWSYNVARLLLARVAERVHGIYTDSPTSVLLHHAHDIDHCVIKCHDPDRDARGLIRHHMCKTIYTYREPIDCMASGADLGMPFEQTLSRLKDSLELMRFQLEAGGTHFVWYGDITDRPRDQVRAIADYLAIDAGDEIVDGVATMLSHENVRHVIRNQHKSSDQLDGSGLRWDPKTLFNERHIRDNPSDAADVVTPEQRTRIHEVLADWTDETGYLFPEVRAHGMVSPPSPSDPEIGAEPLAAADPEAAPPAAEAGAAPASSPEGATRVAADPPPAASPSGPASRPPSAAAAPAQPAAAAPGTTPPATPVRPVRNPATRPTEAAKLDPSAAAERARLARDLLRSIGRR